MKLSLYRPVKPFYIGQHFGQSEACIEEKAGVPLNTLPVVAKINNVCPTGFRELYPLLGMKGHTGIDCSAMHRAELYACTDGEVFEISSERARGLGVDVLSKDSWYDGGEELKVKWRYWHLDEVLVRVGDIVRVGDLIGYADNTGFSAGDHLHWECKIMTFKDGQWIKKYPDNGYYGAFDFEQWILPNYSQDHNAEIIHAVAEATKNLADKDNILIRVIRNLFSWRK